MSGVAHIYDQLAYCFKINVHMFWFFPLVCCTLVRHGTPHPAPSKWAVGQNFQLSSVRPGKAARIKLHFKLVRGRGRE